jgi:hypothetical protein
MSNFELKLNRFSTNKPQLRIRYVDDIFCIFKEQQNINLDVLIIRNNVVNEYNFTIYRKSTNTDPYLLYESNQYIEYKLSLIRTLVIRILLIYSTIELEKDELKLMRKT